MLRAEVDALRRELPVAEPSESEASRLLFERLERADVDEMERRLDSELRSIWDQARPEDRMALALAFCLHVGVEGAAERTGLSAATPPEDVHSMGRGPLATGGAFYYADLVLEALGRGGADPFTLRAGLDFGCSSGRVVRVLRAVLPDAELSGCDPNAPAVRWASDNIPGVDFSVSPQEPPLPYDDGSFDFVYAISIWSHFGEAAAVRWLDEMRRVLRPGGLLVLTVQGPHSIAYFGSRGLWYRDDLAQAVADLSASGFHYREAFGKGGDWGVENPEWGMAFLTPEWLLVHTTPRWAVRWLATGRAEGNQDVVVLQRP